MTDALNEALEQVYRRLERGIHQAEDELAETRERCTALELAIRSLRAQGSELAQLQQADPFREVEAVAGEAVVRIPEAVPVAPRPTPVAAKATPEPKPAAAAAVASNGSDPESEAAAGTDDAESGVIEIPTSYMPMLEELWDVARHTEAE